MIDYDVRFYYKRHKCEAKPIAWNDQLFLYIVRNFLYCSYMYLDPSKSFKFEIVISGYGLPSGRSMSNICRTNDQHNLQVSLCSLRPLYQVFGLPHWEEVMYSDAPMTS